MPLINCKIHLELNWTKNCVMLDIAGEAALKITNTKSYVPHCLQLKTMLN